MSAELIIKKEDGSQVKIECSLHTTYTGYTGYAFDLYTKGTKKRTWVAVDYSNGHASYDYLPQEERLLWQHKVVLTHVTNEQLLEVARLAWMQLEPTAVNFISTIYERGTK